jgi:hypothetical protein
VPPAFIGVKLVFLAIFLQHISQVEGIAEIHHCVIFLHILVILIVLWMMAPALLERDMPYTSNRTMRLWFWALAVMVAIYFTLRPQGSVTSCSHPDGDCAFELA